MYKPPKPIRATLGDDRYTQSPALLRMPRRPSTAQKVTWRLSARARANLKGGSNITERHVSFSFSVKDSEITYNLSNAQRHGVPFLNDRLVSNVRLVVTVATMQWSGLTYCQGHSTAIETTCMWNVYRMRGMKILRMAKPSP